MMRRQIAVVVSGFPRRSETFAINELVGLADRGMLAGIFATKEGDVGERQPACDRLMPLLQILPGVGVDEQGGELARRLAGRAVNGIHGYFAHTPAAVAEFASARLAVRFGFSVHAKDARKVDPAALAARAARASCVVACNDDVARQLQESGAPAQLIPHGVDLNRFQMTRVRTGRGLRVLAVGRLVPKKGFDVLIDAMALIDPRITLRIVGDGPERERLGARIVERGLAARVTLAGARTHTQLPDEYVSADVVVVPSVVDPAGDRDGLPNVVLEAMASGRPVVGSDVGAIAVAVKDAGTGILVTPHSARAIADALELLASNVDLRVRLGRGARAEVAGRYALQACVERFARVLEVAYA